MSYMKNTVNEYVYSSVMTMVKMVESFREDKDLFSAILGR